MPLVKLKCSSRKRRRELRFQLFECGFTLALAVIIWSLVRVLYLYE